MSVSTFSIKNFKRSFFLTVVATFLAPAISHARPYMCGCYDIDGKWAGWAYANATSAEKAVEIVQNRGDCWAFGNAHVGSCVPTSAIQDETQADRPQR